LVPFEVTAFRNFTKKINKKKQNKEKIIIQIWQLLHTHTHIQSLTPTTVN